jgi:ribonuclease I
LELRKRINFESLLERNGIVPSDSAIYSVDKIKSVIKSEHGKNVIVTCLNNNSLIFEIYLCYDKRFSPIDCVPQRTETCKNAKLIINPNL